MNPLILLAVFVASSLVGYKLIRNVPSLLHTPLMSGMNALGGISLLAALTATAAAVLLGSRILGYAAMILAVINVAGGFTVTHRMLTMLVGKRPKTADTGGTAE